MTEFVFGLLALAIALFLWAAIGHLLWIAVAALLRIFLGVESPRTRHCAQCGAPLVEGRCPRCIGVAPSSQEPTAALSAEIRGTLKHVERLWRRGILSDDEHARLVQACQRDLDRLSAPSPVPPSAIPAQLPGAWGQAARAPSTPAAAPGAIPTSPPVAPPELEILDDVEVLEAEIVPESESAAPPHRPTAVPAPIPAAPIPAAPVHPLDRPEPEHAVPAPPAPRPARRALADVLAAFMQERNIRWGELVSGLLIVGSAAGLVLSLRDQLREWIPYFPAFLFLLGTSAMHAAGLYTLRKWNLQSTSRGILVITLLLVPLNFLAAVLISTDREQQLAITSPTYLAAVTIGLLAYGAIAYTGAAALVGRRWFPLALGILLPSASQLVIHRAEALPGIGDIASQSTRLLALGSLPAGTFALAILLLIGGSRHWTRVSLRRARPLLLALGIGGFATVLALVLLIGKSDAPLAALAAVSPVVALVAATVLSAGLFITRRAVARTAGMLAMTGTALAIFGALAMLAALGFAWPDPPRLIAIGTLCATLLAAQAVIGKLPLLHVPATACAALALLIGYHWFEGNLTNATTRYELSQQMLDTWLMGRSAAVLSAVAAVVAAIGAFAWQTRGRDHARYLLASGGGLLAIGLGIALYSGFVTGVDAPLATIVLAFDAAALALATWRVPHRALTASAAALSLVAVVHACGYNDVVRAALEARNLLLERPVLAATLAHAVVMLGIAILVRLIGRGDASRRQQEIEGPLATVALAAALLTLPWAILVREEAFAWHAGYLAVVALVAFGSAAIHRAAALATIAQTVASLAIGYLAIHFAQQQEWWSQTRLDPRSVALVISALAIWGVAWTIARRASERFTPLRDLIAPPWPTVDQCLFVLLLIASLIGVTNAAAAGVHDELALGAPLSSATRSLLALIVSPVGWWACAALALAGAALVWERWSLPRLVSLVLVGLLPCLLGSIVYQTDLAGATALRWFLAGYAVLVIALVCMRHWLQRVQALPLGWRGELPEETHHVVTAVTLAVSAVPVIGLTVLACAAAAAGKVPHGPLADTLFAGFGWTVSYAVPLAAIVVLLVALALRERMATYLALGSVVWQLVVSLGCAMPVLTSGGAFDRQLIADLLAWNVFGLAAYALLWLVIDRWIEPRREAPAAARLITAQISIMLTVLFCLGAWSAVAAFALWGSPQLGNLESFLALGLATAATGWYSLRYERRSLITLVFGLAMMGVALGAAALIPYNATVPLTSYYVLLGGWSLVAAVAAGVAAWLLQRESLPEHAVPRRAAIAWAAILSLVAFGLNFIGDDRYAFHPVWPAALGLVVIAIHAALGMASGRNLFAWLTVPLALVTTWQIWNVAGPFDHSLGEPASLLLIAAIVVCGFWLIVELYRERVLGQSSPASSVPVPVPLPPLIATFGAITLGLLFFLETLRHGAALLLGPSTEPLLLTPTNLVMVALGVVLLIGLLWYERGRAALPCLYVWSLSGSLLVANLAPRSFAWHLTTGATALAACAALAGIAWYSGARLAHLGQQLGIRQPVAALERVSRWLPGATTAAAVLLAIADAYLVLTLNDRSARMVAAFGPLLLAVALVTQAQRERRTSMIFLSLLSATFSAVLLSWSDFSPRHAGVDWLQRSVRLLVVLGMLAVLYATVLPRLVGQAEEWRAAFRRLALACGVGTGLSLVAILTIEGVQMAAGIPSPLGTAEVAVVALVLSLLAAALVSLAIWPEAAAQRGLGTSDAVRHAYVYAAQVVAALVFAHLYLARPEWFADFLRPYWPYIVMGIAFAGVGLGEWLQRWRLPILADPLRRTGAFLPLIPAIGWWIELSRGEPSTDYALVMFIVGLLYVVLAVSRRSTLSAAAAAVAGNVALWAMLADRGWSFQAHPQFWLIPPAVAVLLAVQLQQKRLRDEQVTAARYAAMLVIYLSSTSEIFIRGVGDSLWPPMILATLAILGVLAGIALQIRAFLYLGTTFVFLSMVTMVWHASRAFQQNWPWWVFGICVGLAMLVFFGLFEKKRAEIHSLIDRLRQWEQ